MVANQPDEDLAPLTVESDAASNTECGLRADLRVVARPSLGDVVQQRAEQQQLRATRRARDDCVDVVRAAHVTVSRIEQPCALGDSLEQVPINCEAVVRVALGPRSHVFPFGQDADEHAFVIERLEDRNGVLARAQQTKERRALPHVPRRFGDVT